MPDVAAPSTFRARVVIPTTIEPISIIGLAELTGGGKSTITVDKTPQQAIIADKYKAFVHPTTGLINLLFDKSPYPVYRMDISKPSSSRGGGEPIAAGFSWQLAVLIAHALRADRDRLAFDDDAGGDTALVWATGEVKSDLRVAVVGNVGDKMRNARPLFEQAIAEGRRIFLFIPAENEADVDPDIAQWLAEEGIAIHPVVHVDQVLIALSLPGIAQAASRPVPATPHWTGNPYRGLEAYKREHRQVFFGRGRAREEALEQLSTAAGKGRPFLLVHGQSGVGKSSLVQAGLAGDIEEQVVEGDRFQSAVITPSEGGNDPVTALCRGLAQLLNQPGLEPDARGSRRQALLLIDSLKNAAPASTSRQSSLLVIDQLEEVFDPAIAVEQAEAFGEIVEQIVKSRKVLVIATVRSDALGLIDRSPALARLANAERVYRLDRPSRYELSEIITAPLALAGRSFADRLIPEHFADVAAQSPDSLPLLQTVLYRFYEQVDRNKQLTADGLRRIGGFEGAVGVWAEDVREQMISEGIASENIDRVLVSLVRIDPETRRPLARSIPYDKTAISGVDTIPDEARILDHIVTARLASSFAATDGPRIRLAHEILTTHWPHLATLVERLAAAMILRDDLEQRTRAWIAAGRDEAELLRGPAKLEAAQRFVKEKLLGFDPSVDVYIEASTAEAVAELEEARRFAEAQTEIARQETQKLHAQRSATRRTQIGAFVAICLAATAAVFAYDSNQNRDKLQDQFVVATKARREAEAKTKIADAQSVLAKQYAEKERIARIEASEKLSDARLNRAQLVARVVQPQTEPDFARLALIETLPDSLDQPNFPVSGPAIRALTETNLVEGTMIRLPTDNVIGGEFLKGGANIALLDDEGKLTVWDSATGAELDGMDSIQAMTSSPDGKRFAVLMNWGEIAIWDAQNYRALVRAKSSIENVSSLSLGNDGDELTIGKDDMTSVVFDVKQGSIVSEYRKCLRDTATTVFSSNGRHFLRIEDGKLHLCDGTQGGIDRLLVAEGAVITAASFSPLGEALVVGTAEGALTVYDRASLSKLSSWAAHHGEVTYVAYNSDGKTLFSGRPGEVSLWEAATGNLLKRVAHGGTDGFPQLTRLSPDNATIFARFEHRPLAPQVAFTTNNVMDLNGISAQLNGSSAATFTNMAPVRRSANLIVQNSRRAEPRVLREFKPAQHVWNGETLVRVTSTADSPENACATHTLETWSQGQKTAPPLITLRCVGDIEIDLSKDSGRLLVYSKKRDHPSSRGIAQVWDVQNGKKVDQLELWGDLANMAINRDGTMVAFQVEGVRELAIWRLGSGTIKPIPSPQDGYMSGFSPQSDNLIYVTASSISLINPVTAKIEYSVSPIPSMRLNSVAVNEREMLIAATTQEPYVNIWDIKTKKLLQQNFSTDFQIKTIAFSPSGTLVATGSNSGGVTIWDARSGALLASSQGHPNVLQVSFSEDEKQLYILTADYHNDLRHLLSWSMNWVIPSSVLISRERLTSFETLDPIEKAKMGIAGEHDVPLKPPPNATRCDHVAANSWDPKRVPGTGRLRSEFNGGIDEEQYCRDAMSANPEEPRFVYQLGRLISVRDQKEAVPLYRKAAEAGYPFAMYAYGLALLDGDGVPRDLEAALSNFQRAFDLGVVSAAEEMGIMAWTGQIDGVPQRSLAVRYWTNGAVAGDPHSHIKLGRLAEGGYDGSPPDLKKALYHYAIAVILLETRNSNDAAQHFARLRRGSIARILPPKTVAALWPIIRDWKPGTTDQNK